MSEAIKPLASLSSGLLARKGQARPATRSHGLIVLAAAEPDAPGGDALPAVLAERAVLRQEMETPQGGKVAFTLRLDSDRHRRLRLASALGKRSAQSLVTEALDHFLAADGPAYPHSTKRNS